ncbi:ArdC-like ssDNA-binding domain-containing protein, partial [Erythrobacter donghaensis]
MRQRPKRDVAQEITNLIIATIEAGTLPWRRPWKKTGMGGAPLRAAGVPYTGINRLYLWAVADHYGYGSRYWMTWRQAIELGGKVRKGETAEPSIYFNSTKKT